MSGWGWIRAGHWQPYDVVRVALGLLLLTAAALKGHQLATDPIRGRGILESFWFLTAVIEFELLFGLWLLFGLYARHTRFAAVGVFAVFACVSLLQALRGQPTCGCFGKLSIDPWYTCAIDSAAVVCLLLAKKGRALEPEIAFDQAATVPARVWASLLVSAAILSCVGGASLWFIRQRNRTENAQQTLVVSDGALDFGEVWCQRRFPWTLPLYNASPEPITITGLEASCACTSVDGTPMTVRPGETAALQLQLDLQPKRPAEFSGGVLDFTVPIVPIVKESLPRTIIWQLQGRVRQYPVTLVPGTLDFGDSLIRGTPFSSADVEAKCSPRICNLTAECDESLAAVEVLAAQADASGYRIKVTPCKDLPLGPHRFEVLVRPVLRQGAIDVRLPPWPLLVSADVQTDVYASPSTLSLGTVPLGTTVRDTVCLVSRTKRQFAVLEVKFGSEGGVDVRHAGESGEGRKLFAITQRATEPSDHLGTVDFVVREEGQREPYSVGLTVSYHGLPREARDE
jgi:hypothetical protein